MRPASIVQFERLWIAALILGTVNMAVAWAPTLAVYRALGLFAPLGLAPAVGLAMIDAIGLAIQILLLVLIARAGSRVARIVAILFACWVLIALGRALGERAALPGAEGMLAVLCVILQVAGALLLLRPDARAWMRGHRG